MTVLPYLSMLLSFLSIIYHICTSQAIPSLYKAMISSGFQTVTPHSEPGTWNSTLTMKVVTNDGKVVSHNLGLNLSTELVMDTYHHFVAFNNLTLKTEFRKINVLANILDLTEIYDIATEGLSHQDVLDYISQMARFTHYQPQLTLRHYDPSIGYKHFVWVSLTPNGVNVLDELTFNTGRPLVITTRELENQKMYRDVECVIESAITANGYVRALPNGRLGLSPLNITKGAAFLVRQYLGFTSNVQREYKEFEDGTSVHVQIFLPERWPNGSARSPNLGKAAYVSRGYKENVFVSTKGSQINNFALSEKDPRFFYTMKLQGTDFSVFLSTSKLDHYLAVRMPDRELYLQNVPHLQDFERGYDNAKFKVFQIGKHLNFYAKGGD